MHLTEIDLATQKQMVIDLQVQKAKEEVQLAREVAEVEKKASYPLGVEETKIRLAEELSEVCWDYCDVTWDKVLTVVGVPADSVLRLPGSMYYHPQICEIPSASSPLAPAPESFEQPLAIPYALPFPEISNGSSQVGDQGQGAKGEKGKDKDKGKKPFAKAKDTAKVKEAEART